MGAIPVEDIFSRAILVLRGHRVLLHAELATLYGVSTKRFNEQVAATATASQPISCSSSPPMSSAL